MGDPLFLPDDLLQNRIGGLICCIMMVLLTGEQKDFIS